MTKADIVKTLKEQAGLASQAQAQAAFETLFGTIADALKQGEAVRISGFGTFSVVERKARKGRNPQTGKDIQIPARRGLKFTVGKALKDSL
jgi:DNA-binding protein HU-beta